MPLEMPERLETDGLIEVRREGWGFVVTVVNSGEASSIKLSPFNAWRAFGLLAFMLGIPLPKSTAKAIKL
jgi:hypothetical protein